MTALSMDELPDIAAKEHEPVIHAHLSDDLLIRIPAWIPRLPCDDSCSDWAEKACDRKGAMPIRTLSCGKCVIESPDER